MFIWSMPTAPRLRWPPESNDPIYWSSTTFWRSHEPIVFGSVPPQTADGHSLRRQSEVLSASNAATRALNSSRLFEQRGVGHATLTGRQTDCSNSLKKSFTDDTNRLWCVLPVRESVR